MDAKKKKIIEKIKNNIKALYYRLSQESCAKKNLKFYYSGKIGKIKQNIRDLEAQLIYVENENQYPVIDLHGATRYFIDTYLFELIEFKSLYHNKITIMTGKGTRTLYNHLNKYLTEWEYTYRIKDCKFYVEIK